MAKSGPKKSKTEKRRTVTKPEPKAGAEVPEQTPREKYDAALSWLRLAKYAKAMVISYAMMTVVIFLLFFAMLELKMDIEPLLLYSGLDPTKVEYAAGSASVAFGIQKAMTLHKVAFATILSPGIIHYTSFTD
eukprot:CFRG7588T1